MQPSKIDIKCGKLFPWHFQIVAACLVLGGLGGLLVLGANLIVAGILILLGVAMLTATEGTEIIPSTKTYREYTSILFIKIGKFLKYHSIERIFINSGNVSQTIYTAHTLKSSSFVNVEYRAYLKLVNGEKILLTKKRDKVSLLQQMKKVASEIQTELIDTTAQG